MSHPIRSLTLICLLALTTTGFSCQEASSQKLQKQTKGRTSNTVRVNQQTPAVSEVYPTSDVLPENLLRFYVYFSKPMRRENALSFIKLVDEDGQTVEGAFLANRFNLWSPDSTRLTLLFDPGRVKTGLVAHKQLGRALQANRKYELVIDSAMLSVGGAQLASTHRKSFRVVEADFEAPDTEKWQVQIPQAGSNDALRLVLNGPQDHVSLAYRIRIKDSHGKRIAGRIDIEESESVWVFEPIQRWVSGEFTISIDPLLEDIAGNRLTGLFEKPMVEDKRSWSEPKTITFRPSKPNSDK